MFTVILQMSSNNYVVFIGGALRSEYEILKPSLSSEIFKEENFITFLSLNISRA